MNTVVRAIRRRLRPLRAASDAVVEVLAGAVLRFRPYLVAVRRPRLDTDPTSDVIISLTSFPARIESVWATIDSLLRQSQSLRAVVLVLSEEEFPERWIPPSLIRRTRRGLTVHWVPEDHRNFDKLLPALTEFPHCRIITVDDDKLYPRDMAKRLVTASDKAPRAIIGTSGRLFAKLPDGRIHTGPVLETPTSSDRLYLLNGTGVLYPPGSLDGRVHDFALIRQLCPTSDDVWFWVMSLVAGTDRRCLGLRKPPANLAQSRTPTLQSVNRTTKPDQVVAAFRYFGLLGRLDDTG